jgi:hypothetical protein
MDPPDNCFAPDQYLDLEHGIQEGAKPVICYTRKPGMIVSYENDTPWVKNVPASGPDEYVIGVFTLNSENELKDSDMSLEEYIRAGELADHCSWTDRQIGRLAPSIVNRIQNGGSRKLSSLMSESKVRTGESLLQKQSARLGKLFLPPQGFGKEGSPNSNPGDHEKTDMGDNTPKTPGGVKRQPKSRMEVDTGSVCRFCDRYCHRKRLLLPCALVCGWKSESSFRPAVCLRDSGIV